MIDRTTPVGLAQLYHQDTVERTFREWVHTVDQLDLGITAHRNHLLISLVPVQQARHA
jgi:hypothetical protein